MAARRERSSGPGAIVRRSDGATTRSIASAETSCPQLRRYSSVEVAPSGRAPRRADGLDAGERSDRPVEGAARARPRVTGGPRAAQRAADRGARAPRASGWSPRRTRSDDARARTSTTGRSSSWSRSAVKLRLADCWSTATPRRRTRSRAAPDRDGDALEDLRDLARGDLPAAARGQGTRGRAGRRRRGSTGPGRAWTPGGVGRYPQDVEAAVYFSCLEALQNIAKYAAGVDGSSPLARTQRRSEFEVHRRRRGFDPHGATRGTGLQGMADRLDADRRSAAR